MSSIAIDLAAALSTISRPGDFCIAGTADLLAPRLEVEGVGPIALPLLPVQAEQLIATAERAPYGRGEDTLTDTKVRRTWQIGSERVRIGGRHWPGTLQTILLRAAEGLGVSGPVDAEFYKLLVYDQGSFCTRAREGSVSPKCCAGASQVDERPAHSRTRDAAQHRNFPRCRHLLGVLFWEHACHRQETTH